MSWKNTNPYKICSPAKNQSPLFYSGISFQNLFQKLLSDKDPIKSPIEYSGQVRTIPVFENYPGLFQAGEDIGRIRENYRNVQDTFHKQSVTVFLRYGASCPSNGCGRCEHPDCFFSEFIRNYWDYPNGD